MSDTSFFVCAETVSSLKKDSQSPHTSHALSLKNRNPLFSKALLEWYDQAGRTLLWRTKPVNPYYVLLSEFMLHQTTIYTVKPYFERFIERMPTLLAFSKASLEEVLALWQGLGYYRRAHHLHALVAKLMHDYKGVLPDDAKTLESLPGIGPYTSAMLRAVLFDQKVAVVDGNVARVFSRVLQLNNVGTALLKEVRVQSESFLPEKRLGDYAQALMDLGAMVCRPQKPLCNICPLGAFCASFKHQTQTQFPLKKPLKKTPQRYGHAFVLKRQHDGALFLMREEGALLKGLWRPFLTIDGCQTQSNEWQTKSGDCQTNLCFPLQASWHQVGSVHHIFTHFRLKVCVWVAFVSAHENFKRDIDEKERSQHEACPFKSGCGCWVSKDELSTYGLSKLAHKILQCVEHAELKMPNDLEMRC